MVSSIEHFRIEEAYSFLIISGIGSGFQKAPKEIIDSDSKPENELKNCDSQTVVDASQASVVADALKEFEEEKFKPQLHCGTSEILSDDMLSDLAINLPSNLAGSNLFLVYQTGTHGYSLGTIYRKMKSSNFPSLLLIKDNSNTVFGAYMPDNLHISTHYYGTGETFVFHWKPNFKKYEWTRENSFFLKGDRDCFAIGSKSGRSAIWFEDTLKYGRSEPTDTFENPTLCGKCNEIDQNNAESTINMLSINKSNTNEDSSNENSKEFYFVINCLEVWRFAM